MVILLYVLGGLFFVSTIVLAILFGITLDKKKKTEEDNKNTIDTLQRKNITLSKTIDEIKTDIDTTEKKGFYEHTINLLSPEQKKKGAKGEQYDLLVYIREKERYTNGMSEIYLTKIELVSGFDHSQYDWVKQCTKDKFSTLKKTSDIQWLEPIIPLNKQRLDKINKLLENIKEKQDGTE